MHKKLKNISLTILAGLSVLAISGCASSTTTTTGATAAVRTRTVQVQKGNLDVTVSVDGNLVMPEAFNLHFGAAGDVKEVLVTEGDRVKAGAILAKLDDTAQRLDVKSAVNGMQTTLSNLYETVPRLPQFPTTFYDYNESTSSRIIKPRFDWQWDNNPASPTYNTWIMDPNIPYNTGLPVGYPGYYPNATALTAYYWAAGEVASAQSLFLSENYTWSATELYIATADLESCLKILEDAALNPSSGLGNIEPFVPTDMEGYVAYNIQQDNSFDAYFINELRKIMTSIKGCQDDISKLRELVKQGKKDEATLLFNTVLARLNGIGTAVLNNINIIKTNGNTEVYGKEISIYLYNAASSKLDAALEGIENGGINSDELSSNLRIAEHYMMLCNGILGSNDYVLQHGLLLQRENAYKVQLETNLINLSNKKDDFLKTVIMTPVDGVVVSVGVKKNDVLSAQDYSSKGTIQVVDTSQIKFTGTVDEIDIIKIKTGQTASVSVDAISNKTFPGKVSFISPFGAASTGGVVKFNVTVLLDPTDIDLKGGLTATADIAISRVENALLLPVTAVTTNSSGSFVNVSTDNTTKTEKKTITLGAQTQQYVQILSGLKEGDRVVITEKATGVTTTTQMGGPPGGGPPPGR
jgi:multidrug efflux pump subunit AcrA (membrane-fusion protein)